MRMSAKVLVVLMAIAIAAPSWSQHAMGRGKLGLHVGVTKLIGDDRDWSTTSPSFGATIGVSLSKKVILEFHGGMATIKPRDKDASGLDQWIKTLPNTPFKTFINPITASLRLNLSPDRKFNPYALLGAGILVWDLKESDVSVHGSHTNPVANTGLGFEAFLAKGVGLDFGVRYLHIFDQDKDMAGYDDVQTGNIEVRLGFNFYFGGQKDSDGDGILDGVDACPNQAEDIDGFEDADGCPDPDNDGDRILDVDDQAPMQPEDVDGFMDRDGVPDPDNDGDGIDDVDDMAPNEAEDMDGFEDGDGAPDPDNDGDGILDVDDACPNEAETFNDFEDEDGCPDEAPELEMVAIEDTAPIVLEGVTFASNSSILSGEAETVLEAVYNTLQAYPEMRVEIRGHTDNTGAADYNLWLSQKRAEAVRDYLASLGIDADRLQSVGFGEDQPIADNATAAGRSQNRRIEFIRID